MKTHHFSLFNSSLIRILTTKISLSECHLATYLKNSDTYTGRHTPHATRLTKIFLESDENFPSMAGINDVLES